jgi:hypothetical protein
MFALILLCVMLFVAGPLSLVPALALAIMFGSLVVYTVNKIRTGRGTHTPSV